MSESMETVLARLGLDPPPAGAYVGPGWLRLVEACLRDMQRLGWDGSLVQVKQKFGGLRIYIGAVDQELFPAVHARIRAAEEEAARTCEVCGEPGVLRRTSWIMTLCDADAKQEKG